MDNNTYQKGFYFISNDFFKMVNDANLLLNHKSNQDTKRPHYLSIKDKNNGNLFWMVPCSHLINTWQKRIKKFRNPNRVIIARTSKGNSVFLVQNMFPIISKYIDKKYKSMFLISKKQINELDVATKNIQNDLLHNIKFSKFTADIPKIYNQMLSELKADKEKDLQDKPKQQIINGIPQPIASSVNRPVIHSGYKNKPFRPHNSNNKKTHGL
jgi:hypothetical protein